MEQAQAKFTQARQNLNRVLPLYKKNAVSQKDRDDAQAAYDSAKADLDSAKAAVSEAEIKLSHAYVTAPVAGFASREYRTVGNLITAGSQDGSLLTVVNQNDPIYANFAIPSPQFMRLRALQEQGRLKSDGTVAEITLADGTVYQTKGVITFIDKQVNTNTSVVAARAEFVNPDLFVLPGQFVRVTLSGMELVNAILIPQQAVIQTQKGSMVVVIGEGDKAEMRPVDLGDNSRRQFPAEAKGVKAGERIVVEGGNKAVPGQPVRIQQASVQDAKLPGSARRHRLRFRQGRIGERYGKQTNPGAGTGSRNQGRLFPPPSDLFHGYLAHHYAGGRDRHFSAAR